MRKSPEDLGHPQCCSKPMLRGERAFASLQPLVTSELTKNILGLAQVVGSMPRKWRNAGPLVAIRASDQMCLAGVKAAASSDGGRRTQIEPPGLRPPRRSPWDRGRREGRVLARVGSRRCSRSAGSCTYASSRLPPSREVHRGRMKTCCCRRIGPSTAI